LTELELQFTLSALRMIARATATLPERASTDGLIAGLILAASAWAVLATAAVPYVGGLVPLGCAALGAHPRVSRGARIVAWVGAGMTLVLAVRPPPIWPLTQLAYVVPVAVAVAASPQLREARTMLPRGRFELAPILAMGGMSVVALVAWVALFSPDLGRAAAFIPDLPVALLVVGFALFSIVNAILEEVVFRGFLQGALESLLGPGLLALLLPAALFGACHYHGVPSGPAGAVMAGSWAVLLGWARRRTGGLLTPVLAHVAADAAIFVIALAAR